ncbi:MULTISPECIES: DUF2357 domain-containing protein [unclassified Pseudomonas]|uniref:DUF2357 domain-containing protein n=3 Tax=Pseudomonas TaxID=286 RepID=UPI00190D0226|nr:MULTISPECIES: nuclease domain-containing protein [unclassified Pseudomonas]MBK3434761.1 hypothetical protein [Pseudomonas fluorescens]MCF5508284.1 hypothetical protein [Pseudomonas sp. PA-3-6H]MCF5517984.1 hypothetical protein [Pseudomonas sp. PA-3-6E]MBK3480324.1 hypothetical protein [Pseudomonas fluorescens]MCF5563601.1 hypothetical protein [Pseudomonas sp. PA-3-5D]
MTVPIIQCSTAEGIRFAVVRGEITSGFSERSTYHFSATKGWSLFVDDVRLELIQVAGAPVWRWSPGFYAGEVCAELFDDKENYVGHYRLDVAPDASKLGGETFSAMLEAIQAFDPVLLFGTEEAQRGIGSDDALTTHHLQYARLRRYGDRLLAGLKQVAHKPLTSLRRERQPVGAHRLKNVDGIAIRRALRNPTGLALLHPQSVERPPLNAVYFDVSKAYEDQDNPANQAMGLILGEVIRRCRKVSTALATVASKTRVSETRSPLTPRLERRIAYLAALQRKLELLERAQPFRHLKSRRLSAAGLNAISAHPAYARAYRYGWYALRSGINGEVGEESLWISPTWEIYERWCYVMLVSALKQLLAHFDWKCRRFKTTDRVLWRAKHEGITLDIWLQVVCPAVDKRPYNDFSSLSRRRVPDIAITLSDVTGPQRFIVLDAKYRSSRFGVLEGMESAHLYHDSLRWLERKPDAVLLVIPRGGEVRQLEDIGFQQQHGVGVIVMGTLFEAETVGKRLVEMLGILCVEKNAISSVINR